MADWLTAQKLRVGGICVAGLLSWIGSGHGALFPLKWPVEHAPCLKQGTSLSVMFRWMRVHSAKLGPVVRRPCLQSQRIPSRHGAGLVRSALVSTAQALRRLMRRRRILTLSLVLLCTTTGWATAQEVCHDVTLSRKPVYTISAAWTPDNSQLLVVDPVLRTLWRYTASGQSLGAISEPLRSAVKDLSPLSAKRHDGNLILQIADDGFLFLDDKLRPGKTKAFLAKSSGGPFSIGGGLWQWEPVGNDVVAFLDLYPSSLKEPYDPKNYDQWFSGYVRFPANQPADFKLLKRQGIDQVNIRGEERTLMRTGYSYITSIGTTAYILSMDGRMTLMKNEVGSNELKPLHAFPPGESTVTPMLPRFTTSDSYVATMADLESKSMPVGLFSQGRTLYILWRKPSHQGVQWILSSIDPRKDLYTGSMEIPIKADHVVVVPGDQNWAFIEKGPVKGYGIQDVSRVLLVPTSLLQAPLSNSKTCKLVKN